MAKLTKQGWEKFHEWEKIYDAELKRLQEELNDPDYFEGWCMINNYDFVKTLDDEVGILIFGYEEAIGWYFDEWEKYKDEVCFTDINGVNYTFQEVENAVIPYYTGFYEEEKGDE